MCIHEYFGVDVKKRVEMKVVQVRELKEQRRSKQDLLRSLENKRVDLVCMMLARPVLLFLSSF